MVDWVVLVLLPVRDLRAQKFGLVEVLFALHCEFGEPVFSCGYSGVDESLVGVLLGRLLFLSLILDA